MSGELKEATEIDSVSKNKQSSKISKSAKSSSKDVKTNNRKEKTGDEHEKSSKKDNKTPGDTSDQEIEYSDQIASPKAKLKGHKSKDEKKQKQKSKKQIVEVEEEETGDEISNHVSFPSPRTMNNEDKHSGKRHKEENGSKKDRVVRDDQSEEESSSHRTPGDIKHHSASEGGGILSTAFNAVAAVTRITLFGGSGTKKKDIGGSNHSNAKTRGVDTESQLEESSTMDPITPRRKEADEEEEQLALLLKKTEGGGLGTGGVVGTDDPHSDAAAFLRNLEQVNQPLRMSAAVPIPLDTATEIKRDDFNQASDSQPPTDKGQPTISRGGSKIEIINNYNNNDTNTENAVSQQQRKAIQLVAFENDPATGISGGNRFPVASRGGTLLSVMTDPNAEGFGAGIGSKRESAVGGDAGKSDSPFALDQDNPDFDSRHSYETGPSSSLLTKQHEEQSSEIGQFFYERLQGKSHFTSRSLSHGKKKEMDKQQKQNTKKQEDEDKGKSDIKKFTRADGRFKYKGCTTRIAIDDDKLKSYEITLFSNNSWTGVRYYFVPDGEGRLMIISGETIYLGSWKKGVRHGYGEGLFELGDLEGTYGGDWKNGKPSGEGKFFTKRFVYEGAWKDGLRHGFGDYKKETFHYRGDWSEDKKSGYGIAIYKDGTRYEGEWSKDQRSGYGVSRYPDGSIYTGNWSENMRHGKGTCIYPNGNRYVGEWHKDMQQGQGVLYGALDQKLYDGSWWRNKRHGQGTCWFLDTGDRYEGEWFLGKQNGEGEWFGSDGSSYKGRYVDGAKHGLGLLSYPSGDRFVGEWKNGKREGPQCAFFYKDYGKFVGPYLNDKICGQGDYYTFANRRIIGMFEEVTIEDDVGTYVGLALNGKRYGRGVQRYLDGNTYDGEWRDGQRAGYGVMLYEDGGKYVGFWLKDQRSKLGTYSLPSGEKYIGRWLKDSRHGIGTLIFENGDKLVDISWEADVPQDGVGMFVFANQTVYRGPLKQGLPDGRGTLTVPVSVLLKERHKYRKLIGLHHFLKGERTTTKLDEFQEPPHEAYDADKVVNEVVDIAAFIDAARKNTSSNQVEFLPNTVTFWREFHHGKMQDGPGLSIWDGNRYEGDFIGFERSGIGKMSRTSGETFFGEWKHDREWGLGELITRSGDKYLGHWYNGFRNGIGLQSYSDGGTFHGIWANDRRHGIGLFIWPDGLTYIREYYKGVMISKRPITEQSWSKKQIAKWGTDDFARILKSLGFSFKEWSADGMPEYYYDSLKITLPPAETHVPAAPDIELVRAITSLAASRADISGSRIDISITSSRGDVSSFSTSTKSNTIVQ